MFNFTHNSPVTNFVQLKFKEEILSKYYFGKNFVRVKLNKL